MQVLYSVYVKQLIDNGLNKSNLSIVNISSSP